MESKDSVVRLIFKAIDEINMPLPEEARLEKSINTALIGENAKLDSLGLVNFVLLTEQMIEREYGVTVALVNENAMSQKDSPFKTVGSLAEYILSLLGKEPHE